MLRREYPTRVVNLRYKVNGLRFDAAIDCNWELHCYGESPAEMRSKVPIELFCFDHTDWDIKMIFQDLTNDQPELGRNYLLHTEVDLGGIIEETKKWIVEKGGIIKNENNDEGNEKMDLF